MSPRAHRIYIAVLTFIVVITFIYLAVSGYSYYSTPLEERFYHPQHEYFKPSGIFGHGLGIIGTLLILIGVFGYKARKKYAGLKKYGALKYWLEFHIFLCVWGPIMILFHTAFKFGGIVSISFWSMIAVVASGVLGRFIYLQIPRTIQGRELSIYEIQEKRKKNLDEAVSDLQLNPQVIETILDEELSVDNLRRSGSFSFINQFFNSQKIKSKIKKRITDMQLPVSQVNSIMKLAGNEISLSYKIQRLQTMQKYFRYWHIIHLPFALIMLIIMVIHVIVTLLMGARWVF